MLKDFVLNKLRGTLDEWLLGFNADKDFSMGIFSSEKLNLKNAIINSKRVNEELREAGVPLRLKAGMIGRVALKVSAHNSDQSP
jgi:hypothetical protein